MYTVFNGDRGGGKSIWQLLLARLTILEEVKSGKNLTVVCHTCRKQEIEAFLGDIAEIISVDYIPKSILYYFDRDELTKLPLAIEFEEEVKND